MYLFENPVLQRELLVNLRMTRAFVLLFFYVAMLGTVVYVAWPSETRLDLTSSRQSNPRGEGETRASGEAGRLANLFFLSQYVLMSLMAPSFAGGAITGEKERRTYEMLLASPMRPGAIVLGKLLASLCHLAVLVFASLPIVMLCIPLGGVSLYEVLATYIAMAASVVTFGMICIAASSYFTRTIAALVVSYLIILPMALVGVLFYAAFEKAAFFRMVALAGVFPAGCLVVCGMLLAATSRRLLHPPDVGAEAKDVVDPDLEQRAAVGMVIRSDQFPDKLFAPPKRTDLMDDRINPVYDKEMRSELFGQGTLMLRLVIQLSMFLALPLMAVCLYMWPNLAPWYTGYVLVFNMLVGPVFSAGSITGERERQTLELLLTTTISPWQILGGKLLSSLRISCVLTSFLVWPLLLGWLLPPWTYWSDTLTMIGYVCIIALSSLTTTTLAMFCSLVCRKTSVSMMTSYLVVIVLFALPVAVRSLAELIVPTPRAAQVTLIHTEPTGYFTEPAQLLVSGASGSAEVSVRKGAALSDVANQINAHRSSTAVDAVAVSNDLFLQSVAVEQGESLAIAVLSGSFATRLPITARIERFTFTSPFAASFSLPLKLGRLSGERAAAGKVGPVIAANWPVFADFFAFYVFVDASLLASMLWLFNARWRVRY